MLLKIGWREGESLGANNTGLQEPVNYFSLSNYKTKYYNCHISNA